MKVKYIRWSTIGQTGARQLVDANDYNLMLQEQISDLLHFPKEQKELKS